MDPNYLDEPADLVIQDEPEDGEISDASYPKLDSSITHDSEDGEIVDSCPEEPLIKKEDTIEAELSAPTLPEFIPISKGRRIVDYDVQSNVDDSSDGDDISPEEILNIIEKKRSEGVDAVVPQDPNMCVICQKQNFKYKCPRCLAKTCSLGCVNKHKEMNKCDGVRGPFTAVQKLSQYDASKSIEDQQFLKELGNQVYKPTPSPIQETIHNEQYMNHRAARLNQDGVDCDRGSIQGHEVIASTSEEAANKYNDKPNDDGTRNYPQCGTEKFLITNAMNRRIWLSFSGDGEKDENGSKHEQFSDTIFWRVDFIFMKQQKDGSISEYSYRVHKIPESIRLCTVLKQFLNPRKYGCIVSASDLDMDKMSPFIEAGLDKVKLFMKVPRHETERYYVMVAERTILDNTRNRVILDHPRIIVTLQDEMMHLQTLSDFEAESIRTRMQQERNIQRRMNGRGGGTFRGRGAPRGRGAFPNRSNFNPSSGFKRPNQHDDYGGHKRGRGQGFNRGGNRRQYRDAGAPDFDPFEPFEGPVKLPMSGN